jgi:hypothetical protein
MQFAAYFEAELLPPLQATLTRLTEAGWVRNLLRGGIGNLQNNLEDLNGIVMVGGGAALAGILNPFTLLTFNH